MHKGKKREFAVQKVKNSYKTFQLQTNLLCVVICCEKYEKFRNFIPECFLLYEQTNLFTIAFQFLGF